jgi:RING finger protein 113A
MSDVPVLLVPRKPKNVRKKDDKELAQEKTEDVTATKIVRRDQPEDSFVVAETGSKLDLHFEASGDAKLSTVDATAAAEYETDVSQDHRTLREQSSAQASILTDRYQGQSAYYAYLTRHDTTRANALSDKNHASAPHRLATHIRNTCRFDYAPDLCKDYNETGFCGFGDSCKFVHDRGDYKAGWELDDEWDEQRRRLKAGKTEADYEIKEEVVTAVKQTICDICNEKFKKPIVETKCGHLFCEKCAIQYSRKFSKCKTCGTVIDGIFKVYKLVDNK